MANLPVVFDTFTGEFKLLFKDVNNECQLSSVDTDVFFKDCKEDSCIKFNQIAELLSHSPWIACSDLESLSSTDC